MGGTRALAAALAIALAALACAPASAPAVTPRPAAAGPVGPEDVDLSRHSVPLDDIHFDTFDGGSIPLSRISRERIASLRDAIPPLDAPQYDAAAGGAWLDAGDLVLGYVTSAGSAYAYPAKILNFHEIVNDELDGLPVLVSYCPLCRSGVVFDRRLDGRVLSFGNTSALYESDLVMFDRETGSYWWQVAGRAIVGALTGKELRVLPALTTTWGEWRALHPDTKVLSRSTGYARPYARDPFLGLREALNAGRFPFPVTEAAKDRRLDPGEEVLGARVGARSVAYPLRRLGDAAVNDVVDGIPIVVFSRAAGPSGAAFRAEAGGRRLTFTLRAGSAVDAQTGSRWSFAGEATEGPLKGSRLEAVPSRAAFWFSYVAAFPDTEVRAGSP